MVINKNVKNLKKGIYNGALKEKFSVATLKKIKKENPRRAPVAARLVPKPPIIKKYYTIEEDAIILKVLADAKNTVKKGASLIKLLN